MGILRYIYYQSRYRSFLLKDFIHILIRSAKILPTLSTHQMVANNLNLNNFANINILKIEMIDFYFIISDLQSVSPLLFICSFHVIFSVILSFYVSITYIYMS